MKLGAPLFALSAKGGHDAARSAAFDSGEIPWCRQHRTRPCTKRKDGAPTVLVMPRGFKGRATRLLLTGLHSSIPDPICLNPPPSLE